MQNLVASLAIASFAALARARATANLALIGGQPTAEVAAAIQAEAFGDVFGAAMQVIGLAFMLAWVLRRPADASDAGLELEPGAGIAAEGTTVVLPRPQRNQPCWIASAPIQAAMKNLTAFPRKQDSANRHQE